jgi:hypothetical protein
MRPKPQDGGQAWHAHSTHEGGAVLRVGEAIRSVGPPHDAPGVTAAALSKQWSRFAVQLSESGPDNSKRLVSSIAFDSTSARSSIATDERTDGVH